MESEESLPTKKMGDRLKKQRNFILDAWLSFVKKFSKFSYCVVSMATQAVSYFLEFGSMVA